MLPAGRIFLRPRTSLSLPLRNIRRAFSTFNDNPYHVLKITSLADQAEIKKAYYREAKKCHPDLAGRGNPEKFKKVAWAYEILSNPSSRLRFDQTGYTEGKGSSVNYEHAEDLFQRVFQDLGIKEYVEEVSSDFGTALEATRHGDYSLMKDFASERKLLLGGIIVPLLALTRLPGLASIVLRLSMVVGVGILHSIPPRVAFRIFRNFVRRI